MTAIRLASAGADVVITSRHLDEATATADEIARDYGHRAIAIQADVTVALGLPKLGLALEPGRSHAGRVQVAHIGIQGPAGLLVFFPGLLFGWLWSRGKALSGAVIFHFLCNALVLVALKDPQQIWLPG